MSAATNRATIGAAVMELAAVYRKFNTITANIGLATGGFSRNASGSGRGGGGSASGASRVESALGHRDPGIVAERQHNQLVKKLAAIAAQASPFIAEWGDAR